MGLRGCGKTTLSGPLAARRGMTSIDLDHETLVELRAEGKAAPNIAAVWREHGEAAFRAAEARALRRALGARNAVIALGGGTPTAPGAPDLISQARGTRSARFIYLRATAPTLRARMESKDDASRPSLTGAGTLDEIDRVLATRDPLYRSLADVVIEIDGRTKTDVLDECDRSCP